MSNKIIRLESLTLMDYDHHLITRMIEVGHPYDEPHFKMVWDGQHNNPVECHSDRDVVSIECIRSLCDSDGYCYIVRLKDGNELSLPIHAFIAETKEVTDNGIR